MSRTTQNTKRNAFVKLCFLSALVASLAFLPQAADAKRRRKKSKRNDASSKVVPKDADAKEDTASAIIKPWAKGVSPEAQEAAFEFFETGNEAFSERSYANALKSYRQAIEIWDHPAIRFNMAECLIHLEQPVLAYENLNKALVFGADPLDESIYSRALTNKKLLEGQLSNLVVENREADAKVTLDGEHLTEEAEVVKRVIKPGRHQVVAKKKDFLTDTKDLVLLPGETTKVELKLIKIGEIPMVRRWSAWKPWAVIGGGAVVAAAGIGLQARARSNNSGFDSYVARECPFGCVEGDLPSGIRGKRDSAELQNTLSIGAIGVGAVALTVGAGLAILNQPRRKYPQEQSPGASFSVSPSISSSGAGVALSGNF